MGAYSQVPTAWQMPLYSSRFPKGKRQYLGKQEVVGGDPTNLFPLLWLARLSSVLFLGGVAPETSHQQTRDLFGSFQVQPRAPTEHLSRGSGNGLEKNRMMVANKSQNCLTPQNSFFQYCQQHVMKGAPLWCWHGTHCPPGPEHDWTGKVFSSPYTEMEWLFFFVFGGAGTWQKQQCSLNLWWKNVKENLRKSKVKIHLNCNMCG